MLQPTPNRGSPPSQNSEIPSRSTTGNFPTARPSYMRCNMADPRISHIDLDQRTIIWRNADIEQERRIAIFDLLEGNIFAPQRAWLS